MRAAAILVKAPSITPRTGAAFGRYRRTAGPAADRARHHPVTIEEEMRRSYLDYAMSVIVARALPDVRDGLKPVHRRILYSMQVNGNVWNRGLSQIGPHRRRRDG